MLIKSNLDFPTMEQTYGREIYECIRRMVFRSEADTHIKRWFRQGARHLPARKKVPQDESYFFHEEGKKLYLES